MSDSEEESSDKQLKVVLIGDGSSGKVISCFKCLVCEFSIDNHYDYDYHYEFMGT